MSAIQISKHDRCPACGRKLVNLLKDRNNILLTAPCGAIICSCGCHWEPRALIDAKLKQSRSPIISPTGDDFKFVREK